MDFNYKPTDNRKPLEKFAKNINQEILNNRVDPIIGREEEIRRLIEIISRKTKNNPVLIGEPGVGKTAIVEGLVQRIVSNDVPSNLKNKVVYELSLSSIIGGASYQGQFEERLNEIIKEVKNSNGDIILFIDEVHQLIGMGKNGQSGMDAANILKPMMARGEIKIIGATTLAEYREYIEKDAALERRMQKIYVKEPSKIEALTIMRGLKERWELFHNVKISDSALTSAVDLSDRYISDRFLPDKSIDLIDEAAAKLKTEISSLPVELDQINRKIIHLETEKAALTNESDEKSKQRLKIINEQLKQEKVHQEQFEKEWKKQKQQREKLNQIKLEIENSNKKIEKFQSEGEFEKASKLLYITLPKLKEELNDLEKIIQKEHNTLVKNTVTDNEIAEVVAKITGIPLNKLVESEREKILNLENDLKLRVKGQNHAVKLVSSAILRSRAGINDPKKPIGSFLFIGPTGVGKTELAKALAFSLFNEEKAMIRIDMSEYMEKHSISKLIGAPPGYVGYENAGILTEAVRRRPYSVVLFDEIEKAHNDVLNILLQTLDDGQLRDSQGRLVNFKNTIIIMTSNIGSNFVLNNKKDEALILLKEKLRPELINRIDEIIIFDKLSNDTLSGVVENILFDLTKRLEDQDYKIEFKDTVVQDIIKNGYDEAYGARPIKRYIQKNIENFLAEEILKGKIKKNIPMVIECDRKGKIFVIKKHN